MTVTLWARAIDVYPLFEIVHGKKMDDPITIYTFPDTTGGRGAKVQITLNRDEYITLLDQKNITIY